MEKEKSEEEPVKDHRALDQILASLVQGTVIPLVGISAWLAMVLARYFLEADIDPFLMGSALALAGVGKALEAFKVVKK